MAADTIKRSEHKLTSFEAEAVKFMDADIIIFAMNHHDSVACEANIGALASVFNIHNFALEEQIGDPIDDYKTRYLKLLTETPGAEEHNAAMRFHNFDIADRENRLPRSIFFKRMAESEQLTRETEDLLHSGVSADEGLAKYANIEARREVSRIEMNSINPILKTRVSHRVNDEMAFNIKNIYDELEPGQVLGVIVGAGHVQDKISLENLLKKRFEEEGRQVKVAAVHMLPVKGIESVGGSHFFDRETSSFGSAIMIPDEKFGIEFGRLKIASPENSHSTAQENRGRGESGEPGR